MNELSYLRSVVLGLIQGITEFLPISSSGHLAITQHVMDLEPDSHVMLAFDVATHLGTLGAVALVFAGTFARFLSRLAAESAPSFTGRRIAWRMVLMGVAASISTAAIGLLFKDQLEAAFGKPHWIGTALIVTGTLLYVTGKIPRPQRGWMRFGVFRSFLVGIAQGAAIMPGISRSGTTICIAMILGLRRRWAGEFSFFIAMPAILGAAGLKAKDLLDLPPADLDAVPWGPVAVGTFAALVSGYFALRLLLAAVHRARLHLFCYYCWLVGIAIIVLM